MDGFVQVQGNLSAVAFHVRLMQVILGEQALATPLAREVRLLTFSRGLEEVHRLHDNNNNNTRCARASACAGTLTQYVRYIGTQRGGGERTQRR